MRALAPRLPLAAALVALGFAVPPASASGLAGLGHSGNGGVRVTVRSGGSSGGIAAAHPGYGRVVGSRVLRVAPRGRGLGFHGHGYGYGALALGAYPLVRHRGFHLDDPVRETRVITERAPVERTPPGLRTDTGIREAGPSRPALYVINPGRREPVGYRPSAKVVHVGAVEAREDQDWGVPFTGPKIVEVRVPRGR